MTMNRIFRRMLSLLLSAVLSVCAIWLSGCTADSVLLPDGGYDYRSAAIGSVILGYPIPRSGDNPYTLTASQTTAPTAFLYDSGSMQYRPLKVEFLPLALPGGQISAPCTGTEEDGNVWFSFSAENGITVFEGAVSARAAVLDGDTLYLAGAQDALMIAEQVLRVFSVSAEKDSILFADTDGILYEYRRETVTCLSGDLPVQDAWYVPLAEIPTVIFLADSDAYGADDPGWYLCEENSAPAALKIPLLAAEEHTIGVRGTSYVLAGTDDSCFFYDLRTGERLDMDMGGLYRFPKSTTDPSEEESYSVDTLTISADGMFVYLYDIDFIYRLNLLTGTLDLAYNEAPVFEGMCILSSMTAVTDEIVLLSQAANEYTEYVAVMTCAVFEDDLPEIRHEDEKIDLDPHPWETEE